MLDRMIDEFDGSLTVCRSGVVRPNFRRIHPQIDSVADFKATLRAGPRTDLGAYPLILWFSDGGACCWSCARKEFRFIAEAIRDHDKTGGWRIVACEVFYEGSQICQQCNEKIESAYGVPDDD